MNCILAVRWTGSDRNPRNNAGNGQRGTDRSNLVLMREQAFAEGKAVDMTSKNGDWGMSYPNTYNNSEDKSLMGLQRVHIQKLALVDDLRKYINARILLIGASGL